MSMEEIEKLRERVERDPDSKLFLPLAEEYRKAGMYEEAIEVLERGLQRQPGYTSAKVALGKIYLEQNRVDDARVVFEEVARTVPDNLFAKKKLVEIYRQKGDIEKAKEYCKKVLELNPMDEDVRAMLEDLMALSVEEEKMQQEVRAEEVTEQPVYAEPPTLDEMEDISRTEEIEDVVHMDKEEPQEEIEIPEPTSEDFQSEVEHDEVAFEEYKSFSSFIGEEVLEPEELKEEQSPEELTEETPMFALPEDEFTQSSRDDDYGLENSSLMNSSYFHLLQSEQEVIEKAEELIRAEQYMQAFDLYAEALREDPDNLQIKQRIEELKQLMKLLGKDPGKLIEQYDKLLRGIKESRDEFFGST